MNKTIRILAMVLVVQAGLSAYALLRHSPLETKQANGELLSFDSGQVDRLLLNGAENESVEIVRQGGQWVLPAADNFPADQARVNSVLDRLHALKHGLPVATSGTDFARFKVDDKDFERHLLLKKGEDVLADLYLGNGAGVNQSYARVGKDKVIYNISIGTYDLPAKPDNWEDKTVLNLADKGISGVEISGGLKLTRTLAADKPGDWQAASLEAGKKLKQAALGQWLAQLTGISFDKVLGKAAKPEYGLDKPVLTVSLTHGKGTRTYQFGKPKEGEYYVLKVSDRPEYFQIAGFTAKPLLEGSSNDKLLESVAPPAAATPVPAVPATGTEPPAPASPVPVPPSPPVPAASPAPGQ